MRLGMLGSLLAGVAVVAGAFGAHALRDHIAPPLMAAFETAARYQLVHALAVLVAADRARAEPRWAPAAAALFAAGIVLFSGSLYALALGGPRVIGAITPLGGLAFIAGWLLLAWSYRTA